MSSDPLSLTHSPQAHIQKYSSVYFETQLDILNRKPWDGWQTLGPHTRYLSSVSLNSLVYKTGSFWGLKDRLNLKIIVNPSSSKCDLQTIICFQKYVSDTGSQVPLRPTVSEPLGSQHPFPPRWYVCTLKLDKPCSLSCRHSALFSFPEKHPREGFLSLSLCLCYFSCSSQLSFIFLISLPPLPLPQPLQGCAVLSTLFHCFLSFGQLHSQHSPNSSFLLPQQKANAGGELAIYVHSEGATHHSFMAYRGGEKAVSAQRGTVRDKTQGQLIYPFTTNSRPCWVVNYPHSMCLMCNIFSVIMVMSSVYMLC